MTERSYRLNDCALERLESVMARQEALGCEVREQDNGATVVDAGVNVPGSVEAGRLLGEVCMGGLGSVRISRVHLGDLTFPAAVVATRDVALATLGSQLAGWRLKIDGYVAMASGPARALARVEQDLFDELGYHDDSTVAVLVIESREIPPPTVTSKIAGLCGVSPADLYCVVVPTASLCGSVQIASRIVEVGVHRLHQLGLTPPEFRRGYGVAPVAPVADSDAKAMGLTNDCILYGGSTFFFVRPQEGRDLASIVQRAVSSHSPQHGTPFYQLFKSVGFDFYKVDPALFSPAEMTVNDVTTKDIYHAGAVSPQILSESIGSLRTRLLSLLDACKMEPYEELFRF